MILTTYLLQLLKVKCFPKPPLVPVELPGHQGAGGPDVPLSESLLAEVVMLPAAQDILGDGVEVVTAVLVTVIVVV